MELAVGVNAAPGLIQAFPLQIYKPPSVVLYTACPFEVPFAERVDTKPTLVLDELALAVKELITLVKLLNDVTLTVANALFSAVKLTAATFAKAFARAPKFVGAMFANLPVKIERFDAVIFGQPSNAPP